MKISFAVSSTQGKRPDMQDFNVSVENLSRDNYLFLGVFDGHGGAESAKLASKILYQEAETNLNRGDKPQDALKKAFVAVDQKAHQLGYDNGTTASALLLKDDSLFVAHVGDSRLAMEHEGQISQLTKDHILTDPTEMQRYNSSNWFQNKSREISKGQIKGFRLIAVSRSLGDPFFEDAISPVPDVSKIKLQESTKIIMASDGLWNWIGNDDAFKTIQNTKTPPEASATLVQEALAKGSTDNITVAIL